MTEFKNNICNDFPVLNRKIDGNEIIYLDSAATTLTPNSVIEAMNTYYTINSANIHRGKHYLSEEVSGYYEKCRSKVANFIKCFGNQVVFTKNATEALNIVSLGLQISENDRVVVCSDSHHSNYLPWLKHKNVDSVKLNNKGTLDLNHYEDLLKRKPKLVAITHCSNVTGVNNPVEVMCEMAKKAGAIVVLDAAQSIPHVRIDSSTIQADFIAFSAHKMLGPTGVGVLYIHEKMLDQLCPAILGGGVVDWVENDTFNLRKAPYKFEAGTPNISGIYGIDAAIDYIENIGFEFIDNYDKALEEVMYVEAGKRDYLDVLASDTELKRSPILSFGIRGVNKLDDIVRSLSDSYGIMCRSGHLCAQQYVDSLTSGEVMRISGYIYNSKSEITRFFTALDEIVSIYGY